MKNYKRDAERTQLLGKAVTGAKALKEFADLFYQSGSYAGLEDSIAKLSKKHELTDNQKNYLKQIIENKTFQIQKNEKELVSIKDLEDKLNVKFVRYIGFVDKQLYNNHKDWFDKQSAYRSTMQHPRWAESESR